MRPILPIPMRHKHGGGRLSAAGHFPDRVRLLHRREARRQKRRGYPVKANLAEGIVDRVGRTKEALTKELWDRVYSKLKF